MTVATRPVRPYVIPVDGFDFHPVEAYEPEPVEEWQMDDPTPATAR